MSKEQVEEIISRACGRIAPSWPLENSVAVNPYLGFSNMPIEETAKLLKQRGGVNLFMPISFYLERMEMNEIHNQDVKNVLVDKSLKLNVKSFVAKAKRLQSESNKNTPRATVVDIFDKQFKDDVGQFMVNHLSSWLSHYFDKFKDVSEQEGAEMYRMWLSDASVDRMPELMGMDKFRERMKGFSPDAFKAIMSALQELNVPVSLIEDYVHTLLLKLLGWASYCSGVDFQNKLYNGEVNHVEGLLAIILNWERYLMQIRPDIKVIWEENMQKWKNDSDDSLSSELLQVQSIFQEAFDNSCQRRLKEKIDKEFTQQTSLPERSLAQAVFCIDVRSEVYRRNLELANDKIETLGFAGFFGLPINYKPIQHKLGKNQCPVLIPSNKIVKESTSKREDFEYEEKKRELKARLNEAWNKFKSGSITSFSFVSPLGVYFLPKLISDSFGVTRPIDDPKEAEFGSLMKGEGVLDLSEIPFEDQLNMASSALTAMGLTDNFAQFVLITGHGSSSVNNPHASSYDCGACGGNSGEVNALTAQAILNTEEIRFALADKGIKIPQDTYFLAGLHNTTTDEVIVINEKSIPNHLWTKYKEFRSALDAASSATRNERSIRFSIDARNADKEFFRRAKDWAQVRPEWGLAGCNAFIVAPRYRTKNVDLKGQSFLHSYDWKRDEGFKVLEAIMTAPMVVTSWINLQYYASTVDNEKLGSGNKTLHNVVSGLGVLEGSKGDLRVGLPLQAVHDGKNYQHLPNRLNVVIEAPKEAVLNVLNNHSGLKDLCDNGWIYLFIMNESGKMAFKYHQFDGWLDLQSNSVKENHLV